jgi:HD domain
VPPKFGRTPDGAKSGPLRRTWGPDAEQDVFRRHATSVNVPPRLSNLSRMNTLASWAGQLAQDLLQEPLPRRWAHVQGAAARARSLAPVLGADAELLETAAWLHDIGYAPDLATTGLHRQGRERQCLKILVVTGSLLNR